MITPERRSVLAWAFYDWANSAYAVTVMAGFFPLFFKQYWGSGITSDESTFHLGLANSLASIVIVILAPVLGAIADRGGAKKRFLALFTLLGVAMSCGLFWLAEGEWMLAALFYVLATIGFSGGVSFSDALLVHVAPEDRLDEVSALGYALGYLGGGLVFALFVWMTLQPAYFGFSGASDAVRASFIGVGIWWAIFSIPVFLYVREPEVKNRVSGWQAVRAGYSQLIHTFDEIRKLRVVFTFLLGYWLYIDGVDTIVRMAVDYGLALNLDSKDLIAALLITQFVGFPAALVFGWLGKKIGAKIAIQIAIGVYLFVILWAFQMDSAWEFYVLAIIIGLVQGGIQSLSRSLYARIIPANKSAEFFGFYNTLGKFAAVIGPALMGIVTMFSGNHRFAMLALVLLFLGGAWFLRKVDETEGKRMAGELGAL